MKVLINITYYIVVTIVVVIALILLLPVFPIEGNIQTKVVLSGSMEPAIHTGSVVVIKPVKEYKIGDVVTFGKDTKTAIPTTHRIIDMRISSGETYFKTKGDANDDPDASELRTSNILGKEILSIPYLGYLINFAKQPIGFLILIILPAGLIMLDEFRKIYREIQRMRRKRSKE